MSNLSSQHSNLKPHPTERAKHLSYANLAAARQKASDDHKYDTQLIWSFLQECFTRKFGKPAHSWQLDAAEAVLLKLDCIVIAGTGAGKTVSVMLILLKDWTKAALIISPLKALMHDQVCAIFTSLLTLSLSPKGSKNQRYSRHCSHW
jgi:ATP-dependent helicase YprA (DUF1998 family)